MEKEIRLSLPESLHKAAKAAAAQEGVFLREFLLRSIQREVERCRRKL